MSIVHPYTAHNVPVFSDETPYSGQLTRPTIYPIISACCLDWLSRQLSLPAIRTVTSVCSVDLAYSSVSVQYRELIYMSRLLRVFLGAKAVQLVILYLVPAPFDVSSLLLLAQHRQERELITSFGSPLAAKLLTPLASALLDVVDKLVTWDAVYFADMFANGISYEHQYVFCPLWWRLVRLLPVAKGFYSRLLAATLLSNLCHYLAAVVLYHYTYLVFLSARIFSAEKMARVSLVLFVVSPAAAFMTAPYSEPAAALASFACLWARELALASRVLGSRAHIRSKSLYVASGLLAAIAFGFRANCLLLGLIYMYDVAQMWPRPVYPVAAGSVLGAAFVAVQVLPYMNICWGSDRGEWCNSTVPSLFAYAQSHYWNNGFLKYWTLNNIPNFAFGAPTIVLLALSVCYFGYTFPVDRLVPVLAVNVVFLVLLLGFWHVQIVTRIHTFLPVVYWLVAGLATQNDPAGRRWVPVCVGYFVVWSVVQVALFGAFLPPA